jgi:hypothetical protein
VRLIKKYVWVSLGELIDYDLEGFLDLIAERAGYPLLMDIDYDISEHKNNEVLLRVTGIDNEEGV